MTNPERRESKGREERCGWEFCVVQRDFARQKPERDNGWMQDSVPPASMIVASECRMKREASPSACAPVVHAVEAVWLGPSEEVRFRLSIGDGGTRGGGERGGWLLGTRASWKYAPRPC